MSLRAEGLHVKLDGRAVLQGVEAAFEPGWTALVGPNGAGKTTLLRCLAGLLRADAGTASWQGRAVHEWPAAERARHLAWMPQADGLSGDLTVRETVSLGRLPHIGLWGRWRLLDTQAVDEALQRTDCREWASRPLSRLSGGERQRVHLARALATGATVLLLDEPMAHLDPPHQWALARLFRELSDTHTVVTVVHDLSLALQADRVMALSRDGVQAHAPHDDPMLHRQLERLFAPAVRITPLPGDSGRYGAAPAPLDSPSPPRCEP